MVIELAEPAGEFRDGGQAVGERPAQIGQAGTPDGRRHLVAEGAGQRAFVRRPRIGLAVVEDQQAERLVAEDERDEADASARRSRGRPRGALGSVRIARSRTRTRRRRRASIPVVGASGGSVADRFDDLGRQATLGAER